MDIKALQTAGTSSAPPPSVAFSTPLHHCCRLFPPLSRIKFASPLNQKEASLYQMDHITLRPDNRGIPSLFCFSPFPLVSPAHSVVSLPPSLRMRLSFCLTRRFSPRLAEEVAGLIKSLLRERPRQGRRSGGRRGKTGGGGANQSHKSIPGLRSSIQ